MLLPDKMLRPARRVSAVQGARGQGCCEGPVDKMILIKETIERELRKREPEGYYIQKKNSSAPKKHE